MGSEVGIEEGGAALRRSDDEEIWSEHDASAPSQTDPGTRRRSDA
jgi:hypothetical protein